MMLQPHLSMADGRQTIAAPQEGVSLFFLRISMQMEKRKWAATDDDTSPTCLCVSITVDARTHTHTDSLVEKSAASWLVVVE